MDEFQGYNETGQQKGGAWLKITIKTFIKSNLETVWAAWSNAEDIMQWNAASDDWHTTKSTVDLREGGTFSSRMEAKDGGVGFDFHGTYNRIVDQSVIEYTLGDGRMVKVEFDQGEGGVTVRETFEAESQNDAEQQRRGWQAILDNFARHVEAKKQCRR
jgi:uncharacterized protein YndB with AHSA1/START domain